MFLAPEGDEIELIHAVSAFLVETMPIARLHQADVADMGAGLRAKFGAMGWFGLAVPEEWGGSGLSAVELALFFREAGRQCGPVDLIAQSLAAIGCAGQELRARLLAGEAGVALAVRDGAALRLIGGPDAAYALQLERGSAALFPLAGLAVDERASLSPANSMRCLAAPPEATLPLSGTPLWPLGELAAAAMLLGLAEAALTLIVDYAQVRETFGRKIGAYQAVRHPCADMALRAEAARCQLWFAAASMKEGRADAATHLDAAKHLANQAALMNADICIQLHGGIGVTDEHDAHLLLKQAMLLNRLFGTKKQLLTQLLGATVED